MEIYEYFKDYYNCNPTKNHHSDIKKYENELYKDIRDHLFEGQDNLQFSTQVDGIRVKSPDKNIDKILSADYLWYHLGYANKDTLNPFYTPYNVYDMIDGIDDFDSYNRAYINLLLSVGFRVILYKQGKIDYIDETIGYALLSHPSGVLAVYSADTRHPTGGICKVFIHCQEKLYISECSNTFFIAPSVCFTAGNIEIIYRLQYLYRAIDFIKYNGIPDHTLKDFMSNLNFYTPDRSLLGYLMEECSILDTFNLNNINDELLEKVSNALCVYMSSLVLKDINSNEFLCNKELVDSILRDTENSINMLDIPAMEMYYFGENVFRIYWKRFKNNQMRE